MMDHRTYGVHQTTNMKGVEFRVWGDLKKRKIMAEICEDVMSRNKPNQS